MEIFSMDFTNFVVFSVDVPTAVDSVVIGSVVAGGAVGANDAANFEGTTIEIVGMKVLEVVANSLCLDRINVSNSFSIYFNW